MPPAVIGGVMAVGSIAKGAIGSSASKSAANQIAQSNAQAIAEQQRQFELARELLAPYVAAGNTGLEALMGLSGVRGAQAQQEAVSGIEGQPLFQALLQQGENAILQNASATGGLRGGNVQGALAQFRPAMLNQQVQQQLANFAGLASLGQNAAAGTGSAGMQTGANVASLLQNTGLAQAEGRLASANAWGQGISGLTSALGGAFGGGSGFNVNAANNLVAQNEAMLANRFANVPGRFGVGF